MRLKYNIAILLVCFLESNHLFEQEIIEPQWKFYFAFEDATGARDTLWNVLDSGSTLYNIWVPPYTDGLDMQFGEIPVELDSDAFNVWTYQANISFFFKTVALPIISSPDVEIYANNFVLPVTISWDTSLFRAPVLMQMIEGPINAPLLDNDYFFDYHVAWGSYCMLYDTDVEMPEFFWWSANYFPLMCTMSRGF